MDKNVRIFTRRVMNRPLNLVGLVKVVTEDIIIVI